MFCILATLAWEAFARAFPSPLAPHVPEVAREIGRIIVHGDAFAQIAVTLERVVAGCAVALVLALAAGIASARIPLARAFFEPAIVLGLTVPGLVWALLCVIWFGVSFTTPVVSVALGVGPALALSVSQGVRDVNPELVEMAHVFRFSAARRLRYLWLPALAPYLLSGVRLALSLGWKVIVIVELFGLTDGVGYQLNGEFSSQNVAGVLAWTILFWLVMAVIEYGILQTLERRLTRWRRVAQV